MTPADAFLNIGAAQRFVLTATMSDGQTRVVQGGWQTSAPAVATVSSDGLVSAVGAGEVTISAEHQTHRAEHSFRVVPNYGGEWVGSYRVTNCSDRGDWEGLCEDEDADDLWGFDVTFEQADANVTGSVGVFSDAPVPVTGTIATTGRLTVSGNTEFEEDDIEFDVDVLNWDSMSTDNREMSGRFAIVLSSREFKGEFRLTCEIVQLSKGTASVSRTGTASLSVRRRPQPRSR